MSASATKGLVLGIYGESTIGENVDSYNF